MNNHNNQIIILWSHPRSMSTAMERIMRERGDLQCFHEPFMYDYYVNRQVRKMPHFDISPDHPVTYEAVRNMLLAQADSGPVFVKDMSYYVMPHILRDTAFAGRLTNCFLIRNPVATIASYYKLDPELSLEEIGLEAQWRHYSALVDAGFDPPVIEAEAVRSDPRKTIARLWEKIGLDYREQAFDWGTEKPGDWDQVYGWHKAVTASSTIQPISPEELKAQETRFRTLAKQAPFLQEYHGSP